MIIKNVIKNYGLLCVPVAVAIPGLAIRFGYIDAPVALTAVALAIAVIGSAFLLSWGAELAEKDIGTGLALAILALIAVLPEYAVDAVFAWKAGQDPAVYAPLALANMTGANRLLIGVGWPLVALLAVSIARKRAKKDKEASRIAADKGVRLAPLQSIEVAFLTLASIYAVTLPLRRTLTLIDSVVLFGIFTAYVWRLSRVSKPKDDDDNEESELYGPAARVAALPPKNRRWVAAVMFMTAAALILLVAEAFAESLVQTGKQLNISEFLLVQWVAPLASETPEFIAVILLASRLQASSALGALISSKVNQWTLLVGVIPIVFAVSAGGLGGLPIDAVQREELFLTAAQSIFAVMLISRMKLSQAGSWALLTLFAAQFVLAWILPEHLRGVERIAVGILYLGLSAVLLIRNGRSLMVVLRKGFGLWNAGPKNS